MKSYRMMPYTQAQYLAGSETGFVHGKWLVLGAPLEIYCRSPVDTRALFIVAIRAVHPL